MLPSAASSHCRSGPWSAGTWRRWSGPDLAAVADLFAEDVRTAMPPWTLWLAGRPAMMAAPFPAFGPPETLPAAPADEG